MTEAINRTTIETTEKIIRPYIRRTPVIAVNEADFGLSDGPVHLKLELMQHAGSFKSRGAFTNLLTRKVPAAGVVAASGGNHGAAVAYAAMKLDVPAKIFVPSISSPEKVNRIKGYGADLVVHGDRYADALAASERWLERSGALPVHAFDQVETMLGQGTVGLEFEDQAPDIDTVLVSVGGLIAGIAGWLKAGSGSSGSSRTARRRSPRLCRRIARSMPRRPDWRPTPWRPAASEKGSFRSPNAMWITPYWSVTRPSATRNPHSGRCSGLLPNPAVRRLSPDCYRAPIGRNRTNGWASSLVAGTRRLWISTGNPGGPSHGQGRPTRFLCQFGGSQTREDGVLDQGVEAVFVEREGFVQVLSEQILCRETPVELPEEFLEVGTQGD